jgi:hypothetical protein
MAENCPALARYRSKLALMMQEPFSFMVLPSVADRTSAMLHDAGDAARGTMTQIADKTVSVADRASHRLRDTIPDRDDRDTYLLGAAARSQLPSALLTTGEPKRMRDYAGIEAAKVPFRQRRINPGKLRLAPQVLHQVEHGNREPRAMDGVGLSESPPPFKGTFHGQATEAP